MEEIEETIKDYIHEPCVAGLFVVDEPSANAMKKLGAFLGNYKKALENLGEKEKGYYINLFPVLAVHGAPTIDCYKTYLRKAIEEGKLEYISHDMYPFQILGKSKDCISAGLYNHYEVIKEICDEYGKLPYGGCIPTGGNWTEEADNPINRAPSDEELIWEVNVHLAFGAKMITYFTLCNPYSFFKYLPHGQTGVIDPDGNKGVLYDAVKIANEQIQAVDEYLLSANNEKVLAIGNIPSKFEYIHGEHIIQDNPTWEELENAEGDGVIIGCFKNQEQSMLYVVNTCFKDQTVSLKFKEKYNLKLVDRQGETNEQTNRLLLQMQKGEAKLIVIND